jgi:hypothetical protein
MKKTHFLLHILFVVVVIGILLLLCPPLFQESYADKNIGYAKEAEKAAGKNASSGTNNTDPQYKYNPNDINEQYHSNQLNEDNKTQVEFVPNLSLVDPSPIYNQSGTYKIDSIGYVPNYANSLYLSTTTGLSQTSPIKDAPYLFGGFCKEQSWNKQLVDDKCRKLDKDVCASTDCCVLLGGEKCFAGNEQGPSIRNSYSDFTIVNRDFYYYNGKCYGNCPNNYFGAMTLPGNPENTQDAMLVKDEKAYDQYFNGEFDQFEKKTNNLQDIIPATAVSSVPTSSPAYTMPTNSLAPTTGTTIAPVPMNNVVI